MTLPIRFLLLCGLSISCRVAHAAAIASDTYEPPTYAAGSPIEAATGTGINGGSGFLTQDVDDVYRTNVTTETQTLQYSSGTVASDGGALAARISGAASSNNLLARSIAAQSDTVYFSLLLRTTGSVDDDFLQFGLSDSATGEPKLTMGFSQAMSGQGTAQFFVRSGTGASNQTLSSTNVAASTTYLLVGKVSKTSASTTYNQVDLFLNPTSNVEGTATPSKAGNVAGLTSVSYFTVRTARLDANDSYFVDNLTLGTTFADVVPLAVPEPSSALLAGCGGVALAVRRRRSA